MLALGFVACTSGAANEVPRQGATAGSRPGSSAPTECSLATGTRVYATIQDALSSRTNKAGETLRAIVSGHIKDGHGDVVIPAGSTVLLTVEQLEPGSDHFLPEGRLSVIVSSVTVNDWAYPLTAILEPVPHHLERRGITGAEAARIGAVTERFGEIGNSCPYACSHEVRRRST